MLSVVQSGTVLLACLLRTVFPALSPFRVVRVFRGSSNPIRVYSRSFTVENLKGILCYSL